MGKHRKSRVAKLNRTLAIGAVAGATAIGFGALSSVNAPEAHADWWALIAGPGSGNGSGNDIGNGNLAGNLNGNMSDNNMFIGGQNGNGNTKQTTWGSGNNMNTQFNLLQPGHRRLGHQHRKRNRHRRRQHRDQLADDHG